MSGYVLRLDLPEEPSPETLRGVMRMLGVLRPGGAAAEEGMERTAAAGIGGETPGARTSNEPGIPPASPAEDGPLLLNRLEAASFLGISPGTLDRWRKKGLVPCVQFEGTAPMFAREALEEFVRTNSRVKPRPRGSRRKSSG